jgi:hypothetical protein
MSGTLSFPFGQEAYTLSDEGVIAAARELIRAGLPEKATCSSRSAVVIDGQAIRAVWLFREVTGMPVRFISADLARLAFERLGLSVVSSRATRRAGFADNRQQAILDREMEAIRVYLAGRSDTRPTDEKLCDWVQFRYTFEMYSEARELFVLINPADVNTWYFERTNELANICRMRVE